ncbi:hypothetical protein HD806DRAFT_545404 [Xylariaceae sp. AK1471]|nr:hypothetical protein HD806DRAFT_545404 [Xylariaceae sp. AK1471]
MASQAKDLGDIRKTYPGDEMAQNHALEHFHPVNFQPESASEVPGWNDKSFKEEEINAVDVAIVLLRRLFALVASDHRQEDTNPLAKMIWADVADRRTRDEQSRERARILLAFDTNPMTKTLKLNAYNLLENERMWKTVWDMPAFQLWNPKIMVSTDNGKVWKATECEPDVLLGRHSMVTYSGSGDLGECVSKAFGRRVIEEEGLMYHWRAGSHVVLRVLYDTTAPDAQRKGFDDVREIAVNPFLMKTELGEDGRHYMRPDDPAHRARYNLVAVIRVMQDRVAGSRDLLRLYNVNSYYWVMPHSVEARLSGRGGNTEWHLGEPGWQYTLYYVKAPIRSRVPLRQALPIEFPPSGTSAQINSWYQQMQAILRDKEEPAKGGPAKKTPAASGFLRTPPTAPRSMREQSNPGGSSRSAASGQLSTAPHSVRESAEQSRFSASNPGGSSSSVAGRRDRGAGRP